MSRILVITILITAAISLVLTASAAQQKAIGAEPDNSVSGYPDSPEGLKALLTDIFTALKTGDTPKVSELLDALVIPDYKSWFVKEFGETEGQKLALKYEQLRPQMRFETEKLFNSALSEQRTDLTVTSLHSPLESSVGGLGRAAVDAMQTPITLYNVAGQPPSQGYGLALGNYFYVQGGFRYVSGRVLQALSTAPPLRIRLGGQVVASKLLQQPQPIYPAEARRSGIEGSVILHAIVGTDGHVKELSLVSGDPILADAAITAVRQWQYKPTKLNDVPAEVDTTITVTFRLR